MTKKNQGIAAADADTHEAAATLQPKATEEGRRAEENAGGFCVYLGPSIQGVIQSGTIFPGMMEAALSAIKPAVERYPLIASLVVTGRTLSEDRIKVNTPGNLLNAYYKRLASGQGK